ncbi:hypothetical protein [Bradyrhizobium betae]|uniref:Uncharacterized protein n=1 Tax=Bradyrhizobium betae TaxID=244734 RepID=A0A5P6PCH7_9BRAD|nr:hypothetical protein [Bradyrhizobium betae]MCS3729814.1 hypothetical protein [Bradyrhizobium betae]QFI75975.1 hypothetical protein F8237_28385 [Bradyrhizobium betae]
MKKTRQEKKPGAKGSSRWHGIHQEFEAVRLEFAKTLTILSRPCRLGASDKTIVFQGVGMVSRGKALFTLRQARQDFVA